MIDVGNDFYVLRFTNELDYETALFEGPWIVLGHYLTVQKLCPMFKWEIESITRIAASI